MSVPIPDLSIATKDFAMKAIFSKQTLMMATHDPPKLIVLNSKPIIRNARTVPTTVYELQLADGNGSIIWSITDTCIQSKIPEKGICYGDCIVLLGYHIIKLPSAILSQRLVCFLTNIEFESTSANTTTANLIDEAAITRNRINQWVVFTSLNNDVGKRVAVPESDYAIGYWIESSELRMRWISFLATLDLSSKVATRQMIDRDPPDENNPQKCSCVKFKGLETCILRQFPLFYVDTASVLKRFPDDRQWDNMLPSEKRCLVRWYYSSNFFTLPIADKNYKFPSCVEGYINKMYKDPTYSVHDSVRRRLW